MAQKTTENLTPDAVFNKLYEAAPELSWHVSTKALPFALCATGFKPIDDYSYWSGNAPPGGLGRICGAWLFVDVGLQGKVIELRNAGEVLSEQTLD